MMKAFLGPEVKEARYGLASVRMPNVASRHDLTAKHLTESQNGPHRLAMT